MTSPELVDFLRSVDTPTVCNALEIVMGARTASGFTTEPVTALDPHLAPIVGYAVTATIAAAAPPEDDLAIVEQRRVDYYTMVGEAAARRPTVVVMQDTDARPGVGAFWGEVNVAIHRGLGLAGVMTNGSVRDLGEVDRDFQVLAGSVGPSHAHVHVTALGVPVTVLGLAVSPDDLVHADRHGGVVIRPEHRDALAAAIGQVVRDEAPVLAAARAEGFDVPTLLEVWAEKPDVH